MKVLVVGGGTAGLISALILKSRLDITVDVVKSDNIGIIGVGEGSTEHFTEFMKFVGITDEEVIRECGATYKSGILFDNWTQWPYLHHVGSDFNKKYGQYNYLYARQIANRDTYVHPNHLLFNKLSTYHLTLNNEKPLNQYHFDTYKLNEFLLKKAELSKIHVFTDDITDVAFYSSGYIKSVSSKTKTYSYDFYIDATGFKRLLIGKMGSKWNSFKDFLKVNSAIVFQTQDTDNYNLWTIARAMDCGWMFRLPVWGRYGNGYIFDNTYIGFEEAKDEVVTFFGKDPSNDSLHIEFGKEFTFDAGALNETWIKNCVAIGLSSSFIEPMEASSIGTSIQQSFLLMHRLINYSQKTIDSYNKDFNEMMCNIRDFVALHYQTKKENTKFWKDLKQVPLPNPLKEQLNLWKDSLPIQEDFNSTTAYKLFNEDNFTVVMHGLGLFNTLSIKREYESLYQNVKKQADEQIQKVLAIESKMETITHKEYLSKKRG